MITTNYSCRISTARAWGEDDLEGLAFTALSRTCLHPRVGTRIRQALYDWSRTVGTPQTLKLTIAQVCETIGQTYPSIALTRLKHLATHSNSQVATEVIKVARALAAQGHREAVLDAVLGWCAETNQENLSDRARRRRRKVGAMLFLELAGTITSLGLPDVLAGRQAAEPASFVEGWRAVLDFHDKPGLWRATIDQVMCRWLDAALHHSHLRNRISTVIVAAARPYEPPRRVSRIGSPKPPSAIAELVIDIAQRWASIGPADTNRKGLADDIVIPLTYPLWRRLLRTLRAKLRTLGHTSKRTGEPKGEPTEVVPGRRKTTSGDDKFHLSGTSGDIRRRHSM